MSTTLSLQYIILIAISYHNNTAESSLGSIITSTIIATISAGVLIYLAIIHDKNYTTKFNKASSDNLELNNSIEHLTKEKCRIESDLNSKITSSSLKLNEYAEKIDSLEEELNDKYINHPYESQLVALFCVSLTIEWYETTRKPFSLNYCQGNLDKNFGDFIGDADGYCWIIELKREWASTKTELGKPIRIAQQNALTQEGDDEMRKISQKCHWIGWGKNVQNNITILFYKYWDALSQTNEPLGTDLVQFVKSAINHSYPPAGLYTPIGARPDEFARYINFLSQAAYGGDDNHDTFAAMVFSIDKHGSLKYWIKPNLLSYDISISKKLEKTRQETRGKEHGYGIGY
jgi:hypothetical protein